MKQLFLTLIVAVMSFGFTATEAEAKRDETQAQVVAAQ